MVNLKQVIILALPAFLAIPANAPASCDDDTAICTPNWSELVSVTCDSSVVPGKCCYEKEYHYTCTPGGTVHTVIHRYTLSGNMCVSTFDGKGNVLWSCNTQPEG